MWEICTLGESFFSFLIGPNCSLTPRRISLSDDFQRRASVASTSRLSHGKTGQLLRRAVRRKKPSKTVSFFSPHFHFRYGMMIQCWHPDAEMRPLFSVLVTALDKMLEAEQPNLYVDLNFSATNPFWMSISELSEADSDTEPEVPFQETHLRQVSFDEGNDPNSVLSIALRAVRDSVVVTAPPIDDDTFLPHVDQDGYVEPSELINALGNRNGIESNGDRRIPQNGHSLSATTAL